MTERGNTSVYIWNYSDYLRWHLFITIRLEVPLKSQLIFETKLKDYLLDPYQTLTFLMFYRLPKCLQYLIKKHIRFSESSFINSLSFSGLVWILQEMTQLFVGVIKWKIVSWTTWISLWNLLSEYVLFWPDSLRFRIITSWES